MSNETPQTVMSDDLAGRTLISTANDDTPITPQEIGDLLGGTGFYEVVEVSHEDGEVHLFMWPMGGDVNSYGTEFWILAVPNNIAAEVVKKDAHLFHNGMYARKVPHMKPVMAVCLDLEYQQNQSSAGN